MDHPKSKVISDSVSSLFRLFGVLAKVQSIDQSTPGTRPEYKRVTLQNFFYNRHFMREWLSAKIVRGTTQKVLNLKRRPLRNLLSRTSSVVTSSTTPERVDFEVIFALDRTVSDMLVGEEFSQQ